jgi:hypothetical protein
MASGKQQASLVRHLAPILTLAVSIIIGAGAVTPVPAEEKTPLQGFVEQYAVDSKPLDPLLWPGNKFDKEVARSLLRDPLQSQNIWRRIPDWQAGSWEGSQAVNTRAIKYVNGVPVDCTPIGVHDAADRFIKGLLRDKSGEIWHCYTSDYWSQTDHGFETTESYVLYSSPGGGDYPDFYSESVDFIVDKVSRKILWLRRAKAWTKYTQLSPGMIKEETLRTNFDLQGKPDATTFTTAVERRTRPFSAYEANYAARKSVVEDFSNYLRKHGLASLIPQTSVSPILPPAASPARPAGKH